MFYRLRHKPSGLYFCPSRQVVVTIVRDGKRVRGWVKSNLSKTGKVYPMKPSWAWIGQGYYSHLEDNDTGRISPFPLPFIGSEWEIEENK